MVVEPAVGRDRNKSGLVRPLEYKAMKPGREVKETHACEQFAALAGEAKRVSRKVLWIADTGSGNHLTSPDQVERSVLRGMTTCPEDIQLATANGQVAPEGELNVHLPELGLDARLLVLKTCPRVL